MQNLPAAELIKIFQHLFAELDHVQVIERLTRLVIQDHRVSRVLLCLPHDDQVWVESLARTQDTLVTPRVIYTRIRDIPHGHILDALEGGQPFTADYGPITPPVDNVGEGCRSIYVQPILSNGKTLGVYYLESVEPLAELAAAVDTLAPVWLFSGFLLRYVLELRWHEHRSEESSRTEQALWASDLFLNAILNNSPALISVKDLNGNVMLASQHYKVLAELNEESGRKELFDIYPMEIAQSLWDSDFSSSKSAQIIESELEVRHQDGTLHTYLMLKFPLRDPEEKIFAVCSICTDITERKMAEDAVREQQARLNFMDFHDALTGLPNRSLFNDRLNQAVYRCQRYDSKLALMMVGVDHFKRVNDRLGRAVGDQLLKVVAERLQGGLRQVDTVARINGDQFAVVLEGIFIAEDMARAAEKILGRLAEPVVIGGEIIRTSASIGISVYPQDGSAADELLKRADIAMHEAKESGKNRFQFYAEGMDSAAGKFMVVGKDLYKAIQEDQLCLHYQPQINLRTGRMVGVEALVRWNHPERGLIAPAHFIPLAEETGLIVPLGEWLLRKAGRQQKEWLSRGLQVGKVAINLSPRQLRETDFARRLGQILGELQLPSRFLELEITESSAMEHAGETINTLAQLNEMGLSLAIDDFGTGYSSLAYLKRFPIQKLKIDRSFIQDIHMDNNDASIAASIIGLAHNMQLKVLAEGVENEQQAEWLRQRNCDQAQGYLYAQPVPPQKLESFFTEGSAAFQVAEIEEEYSPE